MKPVICICEGVYSDAITYGKKYPVIEHDLEKDQIKIKGDNQRLRWFPLYCFDLSSLDAPTVKSIWIAAENWAIGQWRSLNDNTDVIVTLSNEERWIATFFTYHNVLSLVERYKQSGECLHGKYFWGSDMVLVDEISRNNIETIIHHLIITGEFQSIFSQIEKSDC